MTTFCLAFILLSLPVALTIVCACALRETRGDPFGASADDSRVKAAGLVTCGLGCGQDLTPQSWTYPATEPTARTLMRYARTANSTGTNPFKQ